ncbi:protein FAM83C [Narcine bancroftii]|uniref:protein FAM83C n=1 Tax=Narcine bancroftii TaxID=1343680 RepID=UPI003831A790
MMNVNGNPDAHMLQKPVSRKPLGKLSQRLEELKSSWRQSSALELSHSEAARLATDALLESGVSGYRRVLAEERELSFLSELEIAYISRSGAARLPGLTAELRERGSRQSFCEADSVSELTSATYFPVRTDSEAPFLDLGWSKPPKAVCLPSESQIIFQRDRSHSIKDIIRRLLSKARTLIAIVMDVFTDVDILCDLLEASNKRGVPTYLLLDDSNLEHFISMCNALDIQKEHVNNMRIRSVIGDTYCTKSGMKFNGQVLEKFMIIDLEKVVAGSYSFTWLSGQVHHHFVMLLTGELTQEFDNEFRSLYAVSKPIDRFSSSTDDDLFLCMSNLRIPSDNQRRKEKLVEPVHSNPSSSWSGSPPISASQTATPAAQVLRVRNRTSTYISTNTPFPHWKESDRSANEWANDPLARASPTSRQGPHYLSNFRLPTANVSCSVFPHRKKKSNCDSDDASTMTPPSSSPERIIYGKSPNQANVFDDTKVLHSAFKKTGNRMTLGHSKLEMMMEYNDKMRAKNTFSRFQLVKHSS